MKSYESIATDDVGKIIACAKKIASDVIHESGVNSSVADYDDLVAVGIAGGLSRYAAYDSSVGTLLGFLYLRIRGEMYDYLRTVRWGGRSALDHQKRGDGPMKVVVSLDTMNKSLSTHWKGDTEICGDPSVEEAGFALVDDVDEVTSLLEILPPKHKTIIIEHFFHHRPLREIGNTFNQTESRMSQLKHDALRMMREHAHAGAY